MPEKRESAIASLQQYVQGLREDLHDMEHCKRRSGDDSGVSECRAKLAQAEQDLAALCGK